MTCLSRTAAAWSSGSPGGAAILAFLMPAFVELMMKIAGKDWSKPFYPAVT